MQASAEQYSSMICFFLLLLCVFKALSAVILFNVGNGCAIQYGDPSSYSVTRV